MIYQKLNLRKIMTRLQKIHQQKLVKNLVRNKTNKKKYFQINYKEKKRNRWHSRKIHVNSVTLCEL